MTEHSKGVVFIFGLLAVILVPIGSVMVLDMNKSARDYKACLAAGGDPVVLRSNFLCVKPGSLIHLPK